MIYLATINGLVSVEIENGRNWRAAGRSLDGQAVSSVAAQGNVVLAGTTGGIFRSEDSGQSWQVASGGLSLPHVRWMTHFPEDANCVLAGTEPASIFISQNGGETWRSCPEVAEIRDRFGWSLPYSPEAGCVRGFAFNGSRGYAAVEVGGALRSDDGGETWQLTEGSDGKPGFSAPAEPLIHPDVHSIYTHPSSPDLVYAPTGGGFYRSMDGGKTWSSRYVCYARAAWIDPADPEHIVLGPANGVSRGGRIEETWDGGATWEDASEGQAVPWPRNMVERFTAVEQELAAVLSNGEVLVRPLQGGPWTRVLEDIPGVQAIAAG